MLHIYIALLLRCTISLHPQPMTAWGFRWDLFLLSCSSCLDKEHRKFGCTWFYEHGAESQDFFMVSNLGFNNTCRTMNNNIHKDHDQSNKTLTLNKQNKNTFTVFCWNICGLLNKKEKLLNSLKRNSPNIICITEHHLIDEELEGITFHSCTLGAKFFRWPHKFRGVCMYSGSYALY